MKNAQNSSFLIFLYSITELILLLSLMSRIYTVFGITRMAESYDCQLFQCYMQETITIESAVFNTVINSLDNNYE